MSPKKAIIIVLILFLTVAVVFTVLYNKKQAMDPNNGLDTNQAGQADTVKDEPKKPEEIVEEKIDKIIEDAKQNPAASPDTVRQEIISTINEEIIKQEESKTDEQKAADLKAQEERQKIIDEINNKIKQAN